MEKEEMRRKKKNGKRRILFFVLFFVLLILFLHWQNNGLILTHYSYTSETLPPGMDGLVILQISDLHNKGFGTNQSTLLHLVQETKPDLICVTGDLIDRRRKGMEEAVSFAKQAAQIAPIYYVTGNHEEQSTEYEQLKGELEDLGVVILDNDSALFKQGEDHITIWGLTDPQRRRAEIPSFEARQDAGSWIRSRLTQMTQGITETGFHLLLAHRPWYFPIYQEFTMDLSLSGHAHGGQIRIPGIGAIFAPDAGFFPDYTEGITEEDGRALVVSRGLGNSVFPLRLFNRPEVVVITLLHP